MSKPQRFHVRYEMDYPVILAPEGFRKKSSGTAPFFRANTVDLSNSGFKVRVENLKKYPDSIQPGRQIELSLQVSPEAPSISFGVEVIWTQEKDMGLRITDLKEEDKDRLISLIDGIESLHSARSIYLDLDDKEDSFREKIEEFITKAS